MKTATFNALKVGDSVTLKTARGPYYSRHNPQGLIPAGTVGTVGAVRVPKVRGGEGYFICVDFPALGKELTTYSGEKYVYTPRVSATARELV